MNSKLLSQFAEQVNEGKMLSDLNPEVTTWICQELKLSSETLSVMDAFGAEAKKKYFEQFIKDMTEKHATQKESAPEPQFIGDKIKRIIRECQLDEEVTNYICGLFDEQLKNARDEIKSSKKEVSDGSEIYKLLSASEKNLDNKLPEHAKIKNGSFTDLLHVSQPELMYLFDLLEDEFYTCKGDDHQLACRIFAGYNPEKGNAKVKADYQLLVEAFVTYLKFKNKSINVYSVSRGQYPDLILSARIRTLLIDKITWLDRGEMVNKLLEIALITTNGSLKTTSLDVLGNLLKRILKDGVLVEVVDKPCEKPYGLSTKIDITSFSKILKRNRIALETLLTTEGTEKLTSYIEFGESGNYELLIDSVRNMPENLFATEGDPSSADLILVNPADLYKFTSVTAEIVKSDKVAKGYILAFANVSTTKTDIFGFIHIPPLMLAV